MSSRLFFVSLTTKLVPNVCNNFGRSACHLSKHIHSKTVNALVHTIGIPFTIDIVNRKQIDPISQCIRSKSTKSNKTSKNKDEDEEEDEFYENAQDEESSGGKLVSVYVTSLRIDAVLKSGLGLSRNKVEEYFYQSRIRVNDEKVLKKSVQVKLGDSVDIVRGINSNSDRYIDVMRLHITGIKLPKDTQSRLELKVKRDKLLTIENYEKAWSGEGISL